MPFVPGESYAAQLMVPDKIKSGLNPNALVFVPRSSADVNNVPSMEADDMHVTPATEANNNKPVTNETSDDDDSEDLSPYIGLCCWS